MSIHSPRTLFPGFVQVNGFGPDEDYESDEEVAYVTLDLGTIEPALVPSSSTYRLIGLDTPTPFLQLSGTIFEGQHQELLGTELLFTDTIESHDLAKRTLSTVGITEQRIRFRQVELKKKDEVAESSVTANSASKHAKSSSKKNRLAGTVQEMLGNAASMDTPTHKGRGRKHGGASRKGKERAVDVTQDAEITMLDETSTIQINMELPVVVADAGGNTSTVGDVSRTAETIAASGDDMEMDVDVDKGGA